MTNTSATVYHMEMTGWRRRDGTTIEDGGCRLFAYCGRGIDRRDPACEPSGGPRGL